MSLISPETTQTRTVLIVDMANIMRSVLAELLIARKCVDAGLAGRIHMQSRGILGTPARPQVPQHSCLPAFNKANGSNAWETARPALEHLGLAGAFAGRRATVVSAGDVAQADVILVADESIRSHAEYGLNAQFPGHLAKMHLITELAGSDAGIDDPYRDGMDGSAYADTVHQIAQVVDHGFGGLLRLLDMQAAPSQGA